MTYRHCTESHNWQHIVLVHIAISQNIICTWPATIVISIYTRFWAVAEMVTVQFVKIHTRRTAACNSVSNGVRSMSCNFECVCCCLCETTNRCTQCIGWQCCTKSSSRRLKHIAVARSGCIWPRQSKRCCCPGRQCTHTRYNWSCFQRTFSQICYQER